MNCRAFEPLIALHAGRDLDGRDLARVEEHLAECSDCRQLLEDLQESRTALKELASEEVDGALLAAVRSGVLGVNTPRRAIWPWVAAFVTTAALVIAFVATPRKPERQPHPLPDGHGSVTEPRALASDPPQVKPGPKRRRVVRRTPIPRSEPLVVKMLTDDPDIVIIWLVDKQGD